MVSITKNLNFKTAMLNTGLFDYSDAYILAERIITVVEKGVDVAAVAVGRNNKEAVFESCAPFIKYISKIKNVEADNAEDLDIVMLMYNVLAYNKNYAKTSASSWQYYRDEPDVNIKHSKSFKVQITLVTMVLQ